MSIIKRLLPYIRPYLPRFIAALCCMTGVSALTALTMYLIKPALDHIFIAKTPGTLYAMIGLIPLLFAAKGALLYTQQYLMAYIGQRVTTQLREELFGRLQVLSMDFYARHSTGKTLARMTNDLGALQQVLIQAPASLIRDGLTVIGLVIVLFVLHWRFALLSVIAFPIAGSVIVLFGRKLRRVSRQGQRQVGDLYGLIQENLEGMSVVKAFGREREQVSRFGSVNRDVFALAMRFVRADALASPVMEFIGSLVIAVILWYGGVDVIHGVWTAGAFFAFLGSALSTYQPLKHVAQLNPTVQLGIASAERIFELLDERVTVVERPTARPLPRFQQGIRYEGVTFRYPASPGPVLKAIQLAIVPGEVVALVGPSGAGKTTLALLLLRFYDPQEGRVLVDGQDIRDVTLASLRRQIGLVPQETVLFNETVRYNIAFGREEASADEVVEAARAANAHEFIQHLPQGYDTIIGERGVRLSGGQRQRLAIARAVLKNPPMLILDEATSSLDTESERLVQEALERLMEHRTVLVIAHRLATVRQADRILVVQKGEIVETGKHQELLQQGGVYHRLHQLQLLD